MKPCDCLSQQDVDTKLNEQCIKWNDEGITVVGAGAVVMTMGHTTIRISARRFKMFAEWYLADQKKEDL